MASTRTPNLRVAGAVVVGNGTYPTRYVRSQRKALRIQQIIKARSGGAFTPTIAPVLTDGTTVGAGAATANTWLQSQKVKNLKGNRIDYKIGKLLQT